MTFPLVPAVALALLSFLSSIFVIIRILLPILPPHPLSRRAPPSAFGLPTFGSLSPADKGHIYLSVIDVLALLVFLWQTVVQETAPSLVPSDIGSSARLWFACTARQTCLTIIVVLSLFHLRRGRAVTFGPKHLVLVIPMLLIIALATTAASVFAGFRLPTLFYGILSYGAVVAVLSTSVFLFLAKTVVMIRRNIASGPEDDAHTWPPIKEKTRRGSFATEDIEGLKEGSSWITSRRGSSVSSFSFSTHSALPSSHNSSRNPLTASTHSVLPKSSYWFSATQTELVSVPPVPVLPNQFRPPSPTVDQDPFRRDVPHSSRFPRLPKSSQNSWLTSPSISQATMSEFSFPTTRQGSTPAPSTRAPATSRDLLPASATTLGFTPALPHTRVLGGYGYEPPSTLENGRAQSLPMASPNDAPVSAWRIVGWVVMIWIPFFLSVPYLLFGILSHDPAPEYLSVLFVLSITLSSPLLALNLVLRAPVPIPTGLFPSPSRPKLSSLLLPPTPFSKSAYSSRSCSPTVIEGRRSGDVWIERGDAVEGRSRLGRAFALAPPVPKLSVLPPDDEIDELPLTPPLPMQTREFPLNPDESEGSGMVVDRPTLTKNHRGSVRSRPESKTSLNLSVSGIATSIKHASRILIAQHHYSAIATTIALQPSPDKMEKRNSVGHSRSHSTSSASRFPSSPSPPPALPLPPTPPRLGHMRAQSSSEYSFRPVSSTAHIDGLSAGILPLLVPGLKVGKDMEVHEEWDRGVAGPKYASLRRIDRTINKVAAPAANPFGPSTSFSSPENHSTPPLRPRRGSRSRFLHYSLPSLGLGQGSGHFLQDFTTEVREALQDPADARRKTLCGGEFAALLPSESNDELAPSSPPRHTIHGRNPSTSTFGVERPPSLTDALREYGLDLNDPFTTPTGDTFPDNNPSPEIVPVRRATIKQPVVPRPRGFHLPTSSRRSSVVSYRKPNDARAAEGPSEAPAVPWVPVSRTSPTYLKRAPSNESTKLRPLLLLKDRDLNRHELHDSSVPDTKPLSLSQSSRQSANKILSRTLKLVRTPTAKERGKLRENETLPTLVVRPPSTNQPVSFGYNI